MPSAVRSAAAILAAALLAVLAAGCGGDAGDDAAAGGRFPVSIPNVYGEAVVEKQPKRVVSIGYRTQDMLLALGVKPVAMQQWMPDYADALGPWAKSRVDGAMPKVIPNSEAELNIGRIAKYKPDLIVGTDRDVDRNEYDLLSKIAPTILRTSGYQNFEMPWDEETLTIGKALGKENAAKQVVARTKRQFAAQRKAHPEFQGKTIAVAYPLKNGGLGIYSSEDQRSQFFENLGFTVPKKVDKVTGDKFYADVSPERMDIIEDVDVLAVIDFKFGKDFYDDKELYQDLDVVQKGNAIYPLPETNAVSFNTPLSIPYCLEKVTPAVAEAVE